MPTAWAAIPMRLAFSTCIVSLKPSPSSPRRFSAGTGQPSKTSSLVVEARIPILPCWGFTSKPGRSRSTMKASTPLVRRLRSWLASTTNVLASVPFVMYSLLPLSRYWPFDRVAVVRMAPESAAGTRLGERERAQLLAAGERRQELVLLALGAEHVDELGA